MKYFAFISYSSKDTDWGKRLQRKLENYRLPTAVWKNHGWAKRPFRPIFFAPTDIQPGGLNAELEKRLEDSLNLIVICSPNSARSKWVGEEISYFYKLGRSDNIHFFIVDGRPGSGDPETECFNPVVSQLGIPEILGANVNEKNYRWPWLNRERAYVQLITKLLGLEFDELWQRHKRRLFRNVVLWVVGLLATIGIVLATSALSKPFNMAVSLYETSVRNDNLPPLKDAVITLSLSDGTVETEVLPSLSETILFRNIPHRFLRKEADVTVTCEDYLPVSFRPKLERAIRIPVERNPDVYGSIRYTLWNPSTETVVPGVAVFIDGMKVVSSVKGEIIMDIPLERQKVEYPLSAGVPLSISSIKSTHVDNAIIPVR